MAFTDRSQIVRTTRRDTPPVRAKELMAGILLAALIAGLGIRHLVPAEALAPAIVTLLFAGGAVTAALRAALSARPIPHHVVRPCRKPDVHRCRHLRSDRAGPDREAWQRFGST